MDESAVQNYLATLEAAREGPKSAQSLLEARQKLYDAEMAATGSQVAPADTGQGSVFFEEIKSLGFYPQERRLVATVEIKRPFGYLGALGALGSYQYIGWWIDWSNSGDFDDTGEDVCASYVHVFDPTVANQRRLPICYGTYRDVIPVPPLPPGTVVAVRAILSWQVKPTGPNFVPVWGNRIHCNVRIDPIE